MTKQNNIEVSWCTDAAQAPELGKFFAENITTEYISHSELQGARALDVGSWRPNIVEIFQNEIATRVNREGGKIDPKGTSYPVLVARSSGRIVGFGLVSFFLAAPVPYGILEDIVIEQNQRAAGVGTAVLDWVFREARSVGCLRMYLESGIANDRAHHFFEREGFHPVSVVMMKKLQP
jgi:GNAT superfamily N-acetyltransferase